MLSILFCAVFTMIFTACGDDENTIPPYDKSKLIGGYKGTCTITMGAITYLEPNFVAAMTQKDVNSLYLALGNDATYKTVGLFSTSVASNFRKVDNNAWFDVESINVSETSVPLFISENLKLSFEIDHISLKLFPQSATYVESLKTLNLIYNGSLEISGKNPNEKYNTSISYQFILNRTATQ